MYVTQIPESRTLFWLSRFSVYVYLGLRLTGVQKFVIDPMIQTVGADHLYQFSLLSFNWIALLLLFSNLVTFCWCMC